MPIAMGRVVLVVMVFEDRQELKLIESLTWVEGLTGAEQLGVASWNGH